MNPPNPSEALEAATAQLRELDAAVIAAREGRDDAIRAAYRAGVSMNNIAGYAGVHRETVSRVCGRPRTARRRALEHSS